MSHTQSGAAPRTNAVAVDLEQSAVADLTWRRFWLGVAIVASFVAVSAAIVAAAGDMRAGVGYALVILIAALIAAIVDGITVAARRRRLRRVRQIRNR